MYGNDVRHVWVFCVTCMCVVCVMYVYRVRHVDVLCATACIRMYEYMFNPNSGATYWVFYIILKPRATNIFQERARLPCTGDGG